MSAPDYSETAVVVLVEKGYGEGVWRASCPIDCGWHGSDWTSRDDAQRFLAGEAKGHRCLHRSSIPKIIPPAREGEQADG
jgi:hypothetical protein